MYLENGEQDKVPGEEEQSTEVIITKQFQLLSVAEAADLSSPSKKKQPIKNKIQPFILCVEHQNMGKNGTGSGPSENLKQNSASDGFIEPDEIGDKLETAAIRQPFDECVQHCECFIPCKSSEHCANHNLATKCCPCCEHCAGALQLFQQRKSSDKQFHFEPDELAVNCEGFGQYEMSEFLPELTDRLKLIQLYDTSAQQHECFDSDPDTSAKDSEQCSMNGFTINISDLVDSLDCDGEHCEHVEKRNQSESSDDGESDTAEVNEAEPIDWELARFSHFDAPAHIYFDGREVSECCKTYQLTEGNYQWVNMSSSLSDKASDSFTEEDSSSDCSSVETKSFKTCSEGSVPSDPCADSSGESDKGAQGDSSDEQTQWESFEDEEEIEQCHINGFSGNRPKTTSTDVILEDYFDLFDRSEYYGHTFLQKQPYISCFDGGDIHAHLYLEEVQSEVKKPARNAYKCKEVNEEPEVQEPDILGEACEEENLRDDSSPGTEKQTDDWIMKSDSYIAEGMSERQEEGENEVCGFFNCVPKTCDGVTFSVFSANGENMFAPFAIDITVESDAYEDEFCYEQNYDSPAENTSVTGRLLTDSKIEEKEDEEFIACSEMEPYWSLLDHEEGDPGVEEYYAYHIKSIQSCMKQNMNGVDKKERSQHQLTPERINSDAPWEEGDTVLSLKKTELSTNPHTSPEECNAIRLESTQLLTAKSDDDSDSIDSPQKLNPPSDIIHSVVSGLANGEEEDTHDASEQYRDSEEEPFDDESSEFCECEYCIPPEEQIPVKPLLPQIKSNDAGKICVVIDLDETLVHSSFKPVHNADFIIPVEIDGTVHQVYVMKRPHVDEFLKRMGELFECVLFTASLSKYADPVSDQLDKGGAFRSRLFRESCVFHKGNYVKDLSRLGRDLRQVIIIDNSPASYYFHPENAVPVVSWFDDMSDTELLDLIPFFERLSEVDDVFTFLTEQRTSG